MGGSSKTSTGPYRGQDLSDSFRLVKGAWGDPKCRPQKGIVTYGLAQNRLNPFAGAMQAAIFNIFRRSKNQILYWGVPFLFFYGAMQWATQRNDYLNSKAGRAKFRAELDS